MNQAQMMTLLTGFLISSVMLAGTLELNEEAVASHDWTDVEVGEVLIAGTMNQNGTCTMPLVEVTIPMDASSLLPLLIEGGYDGAEKTLATRITPDTCSLVVTGKESRFVPLGKLEDPVPADIDDVQESGVDLPNLVVPAALSPTCGVLTGELETEAAGPNWEWWEWITRKNGELTFCYDETQAWTSSHDGRCQANNVHFFDVDSCVLRSIQWGPGASVHREGQGIYSQDPGAPPSGHYEHLLRERETVMAGGAMHCTFTWGGDVPHEQPILTCVVRFNEILGVIITP
jgi:hypothetical protein